MGNATTDNHSADGAMDLHLDAYNAAFCELGLKWHWNAETYQELQRSSGDKCHLQNYLETRQSHLLNAYDVVFLVNVIQNTKARCYDAMIARGPGAGASVNWVEFLNHDVGF